jgi:glycosyltransferase involved in cell wall biosynthesis
VLEAQANGIPVLATDLPALRETVGPGGILVPADAPITAWVEALGTCFDDPDRYRALVAAARAHATRDEVQPERVVARFEAVLAELVGDGVRPRR